jgi:Trk K+ transport system NAD-binding subunit
MLIKRDEEFIVPNGQVELKVGDKLLFISSGADKAPKS